MSQATDTTLVTIGRTTATGIEDVVSIAVNPERIAFDGTATPSVVQGALASGRRPTRTITLSQGSFEVFQHRFGSV
jgi:hypothetical protein